MTSSVCSFATATSNTTQEVQQNRHIQFFHSDFWKCLSRSEFWIYWGTVTGLVSSKRWSCKLPHATRQENDSIKTRVTNATQQPCKVKLKSTYEKHCVWRRSHSEIHDNNLRWVKLRRPFWDVCSYTRTPAPKQQTTRHRVQRQKQRLYLLMSNSSEKYYTPGH